jgi:hypothetical protein
MKNNRRVLKVKCTVTLTCDFHAQSPSPQRAPLAPTLSLRRASESAPVLLAFGRGTEHGSHMSEFATCHCSRHTTIK